MTKQGNFRVIVEPDEPWGKVTEDKFQRNCKDLIKEIERHCDGFIHIYWESDTLCEFCDSEWETETSKNDPDTPYGQPLCCEEARKEWERRQKDAP